jgi:hypothetical protein
MPWSPGPRALVALRRKAIHGLLAANRRIICFKKRIDDFAELDVDKKEQYFIPPGGDLGRADLAAAAFIRKHPERRPFGSDSRHHGGGLGHLPCRRAVEPGDKRKGLGGRPDRRLKLCA